MKRIISILLLFTLLISCFAGCAFLDRFIGSTQTENPTETLTEPIDPEAYQKALIGTLRGYLVMRNATIGEVNPIIDPFQRDLSIIWLSAQPDNRLNAQAFLAKVNPESFYYMCGYYNCAHEDETENYACADNYNWVKFENPNEIQEYYNDEKMIVAFQINETKDCRNVMPVAETVPLITHYQKYTPEFLDGNNVAQPLLIDKTYVLRNWVHKHDYCFIREGSDWLASGRSCVVLDGVCYFAEKEYVEYSDGECQYYRSYAGAYYEALTQVMITDGYSEIDNEGNIVHYRLYKLDDVVDILLNLEGA